MEPRKLKILVVDDSASYRKILTDQISKFSEVDVIATASNGMIALKKIELLKPDAVTLDVEMPEMNGIETLKIIASKYPDISVIMISSLTAYGADTTMEALELGAFDFITKPVEMNISENVKSLTQQLKPKIDALVVHIRIKKKLGSIRRVVDLKSKVAKEVIVKKNRPLRTTGSVSSSSSISVVAIGISTGGPNALTSIIPQLPGNLPVPVVIVQHMPELFTGALAASLNKKSLVEVIEAKSGMSIKAGTVYIAPGGRQMMLESYSSGVCKIKLTDDPPEKFCKPSVDYLFRSVAKQYGGRAIGIIMTGMGSDGTIGLQLMKRKGAKTIAQDEETSVVFGMPREAIDSGVVDSVLPLGQIVGGILRHIKKGINC